VRRLARAEGPPVLPHLTVKDLGYNMTQLVIATHIGTHLDAPIHFADREPIEQILERASSSHYGVRSLIHELVQSELFLQK
jgi:kynurenine formamidase